jgi:general stress protein 26
MTDEQTAKVASLMKDIRFAMFTTIDGGGRYFSRPMANQKVEFDGDLWYFSARDARKVAQLVAHPQVSVTMSSNDAWVSLNGTAEVVSDRAKIHELWNPVVGAWFPEGPDDENIVLLKVNGQSAEYWDSPGGRVATLISLAKAKVTGQPYDGGENERVDL